MEAGTSSLSDASRDYWTHHKVTLHRQFASPEESVEYFHWRNDQYFNYIDLMPVAGQDGAAVLDFGCGPGHDLVGFKLYSRPSRLIGADVSRSSLAEARARLALHGFDAELILLHASTSSIPLESASIDHIHSSGVLHHTPDPFALLKEFRRILKPGGTANIMVYNYDSIWVHLYVAYQKMLVENLYAGMSIREAFSRTTDGDDCPISHCYREEEFIELCRAAGFEAALAGVAVSAWEASLLPKRFDAILDRRLRPESRRFLVEIEIDNRGLPVYRGVPAGIDGCYRLRWPVG
jgi:ubiquinone/menaquinone biosynthesis C-methylase UbiE